MRRYVFMHGCLFVGLSRADFYAHIVVLTTEDRIRPCNLLARAEKMASFGSGNSASQIQKRKPWVASRDSREYPCPVPLPFDTCAPQLRRVLQRHDRRLRTGQRSGYRPHSRNARVMRQSLLQLRVYLLRARVRLPVSLWKRSAGSRDRSGGEHVRPGEDECHERGSKCFRLKYFLNDGGPRPHIVRKPCSFFWQC